MSLRPKDLLSHDERHVFPMIKVCDEMYRCVGTQKACFKYLRKRFLEARWYSKVSLFRNRAPLSNTHRDACIRSFYSISLLALFWLESFTQKSFLEIVLTSRNQFTVINSFIRTLSNSLSCLIPTALTISYPRLLHLLHFVPHRQLHFQTHSLPLDTCHWSTTCTAPYPSHDGRQQLMSWGMARDQNSNVSCIG